MEEVFTLTLALSVHGTGKWLANAEDLLTLLIVESESEGKTGKRGIESLSVIVNLLDCVNWRQSNFAKLLNAVDPSRDLTLRLPRIWLIILLSSLHSLVEQLPAAQILPTSYGQIGAASVLHSQSADQPCYHKLRTANLINPAAYERWLLAWCYGARTFLARQWHSEAISCFSYIGQFASINDWWAPGLHYPRPEILIWSLLLL